MPEVIRVLVVDDHALHRDGARGILSQHADIEVIEEAGSGEMALALIDRLLPDVVLMDIRLPGVSGIEATRLIRARYPSVRVLMVSAYDDDEYVRGALQAGASGYLCKTAPGGLAQVARCPGLERTADVLVVVVCTDHQDAHGGVSGADQSRRLDATDPGKANVHQHDVRQQPVDEREGHLAGAGLLDDLDVCMLVQDPACAVPVQGMVVDDQDADDFGHHVPTLRHRERPPVGEFTHAPWV